MYLEHTDSLTGEYELYASQGHLSFVDKIKRKLYTSAHSEKKLVTNLEARNNSLICLETRSLHSFEHAWNEIQNPSATPSRTLLFGERNQEECAFPSPYFV